MAGNASEVAESVSCAGEVPVPLKLTVCGLLEALSVTVIAPVLGPVVVGVNVIVRVQFAPAATLEPQLLV